MTLRPNFLPLHRMAEDVKKKKIFEFNILGRVFHYASPYKNRLYGSIALSVLLAVLAGAVAIIAASAVSGDSSRAATRPHQLHLVEVQLASSQIDLGRRGFSAGDRQTIVSAILTPGGRRIGRLDDDCAITQAGARPEALCDFTITLPRGQLTGTFSETTGAAGSSAGGASWTGSGAASCAGGAASCASSEGGGASELAVSWGASVVVRSAWVDAAGGSAAGCSDLGAYEWRVGLW